MNTTLSALSLARPSSPEKSASDLDRAYANERSRFSALRASSLISKPRLTDGLWRPLRLDLLKIPVTRDLE